MRQENSTLVTPPVSTVYVGLIEWSSEDGFREPVALAAAETERAERELAGFLASDFAENPAFYYDDSTSFFESPREWLDTPEDPAYGPLTASDWLRGFRSATTAPWWSITNTPLLTASA